MNFNAVNVQLYVIEPLIWFGSLWAVWLVIMSSPNNPRMLEKVQVAHIQGPARVLWTYFLHLLLCHRSLRGLRYTLFGYFTRSVLIHASFYICTWSAQIIMGDIYIHELVFGYVAWSQPCTLLVVISSNHVCWSWCPEIKCEEHCYSTNRHSYFALMFAHGIVLV